MKKILSVMLMFILLVCLMLPAYADSNGKAYGNSREKANEVLSSETIVTPEFKEVEVIVSASKMSVNLGEEIELSAVIAKHGSSFEDGWSEAENGGIVLDAEKSGTIFDGLTGTYVSTGVFKTVTPGTYTIEYDIVMHSGTSDTVFSGKGSVTIEVAGKLPLALTGTEIKNLNISTYLNADGSVWYYKVSGTLYAYWNDGMYTTASFSKNYLPASVVVTDVDGVITRTIVVTATMYKDSKTQSVSHSVILP